MRLASSWVWRLICPCIPSTFSMPNPVARMVTFTFLPNSGSVAIPHFISKSPNFAMKSLTSFISSMSSPSLLSLLPQKEMLRRIFFDLNTLLSLSNGELRASSIAFFTRPSPSPYPVDMIATPPSLRTVFTSLKSRLMSPWTVMISAILFAAMLSVSSAFPNASSTVSSG